MLDPEQLQIFTDSMEWQLIKSVNFMKSPRRSIEKKSSKLNIEFGNYPMKPWINAKDNEGQTSYLVEQVKRTNFFLPPKPKEDMFVLKFSDVTNKTIP